jgi:Tol biopolymer transport system component
MKGWCQGRFVLLIAAATLNCFAGPFRIVSVRDPSLDAPAGGGGDSYGPVLTADGRYVLFASTAKNLAPNTSSNNSPNLSIPAQVNVFVRDRTNGTTMLASVSLNGIGGNGNSLPIGISTNGRYALFESTASDLVSGDTNGVSDIFVRDLVGGTTALVSASTNGSFANGVSRNPAMSADGRFVAFVSAANNLVSDDTNGIPDVFLRDLQAGTTTLVSAGAKTTNSSAGLLSSSESPEVSADGRYVAFYSTATNLVFGVSVGGEVYLRDTLAGSTIWASANARAIASSLLGSSNVLSFNHALSADGKFIAFVTSTNPATISSSRGLVLRFSLDTSLTDIVHTNAAVTYASAAEDIHNLDVSPDGRFIAYIANNATSNLGTATSIYLWDSQTGTNTLISATTNNSASASAICDWPSVDATGRYVAFLSSAPDLVTNSLSGQYHVYLRDVQSGVTSLLDGDTNGIGSSLSPLTVPRLSAGGNIIALESPDAGIVANDRNHDFDVFLRDTVTGSVELVSAHHPTLPSDSANGPSAASTFSLSTDGRYVAFTSDADNLVGNDSNGVRDIFVRDLVTGTTVMASVDANTNAANAPSIEPAISGNGRYVAFSSFADNLAPNDANRAQDVFVRDLQSGTRILVSANTTGTAPGNNASYSPQISNDGRFVLFLSTATDIAAGSFTGNGDLFLRDMQLNTTYALTTTGIRVAAMTPDGRYVAFNPLSPHLLYLWDTQVGGRVLTNTQVTADAIGISPNGFHIAYVSASTLGVIERTPNHSWQAATQVSGARAGLRFSADGRFVVYTGNAGYTNTQAFVFDFVTQTSSIISKGSYLTNANSNCDLPDISADGRFVVYRSSASNLVASADTLGLPDLFLYDRSLGTTTRLTSNRFTGGPADNRSLTPAFSGDGHTLVFQSWGSDAAPLDFNHSSDVLALSFLYLTITPALSQLQVPTLTWPTRPGETYQVQTNGAINSGLWQNAAGPITLNGNQAQFTDPVPTTGQKFYRIIAF